MSGIRGRLNAIRAGRVVGWMRRPAGGGEAVVRILLDDVPVGEVAADRPVPGPALARLGADARGFALDIGAALRAHGGRARVRAVAAEGGWDLAGSPVEHVVPADGAATHLAGGVLLGWAHGPAFAPARVVLRRGGADLLAWPCAEHRRELAGRGLAGHGFRLPLFALLGPGERDGLSLRIEGAEHDIRLPPLPADGGGAGRSAGALPFPDGAAARRALLGALAGAGGPAASLSPALFQSVLNRLSSVEEAAAEADEHAALLDARGEGRRRAPPPPPGGADPATLEGRLDAMLRDGRRLTMAARSEAMAALLPAHRGATAGERAAFRAALLRHGDARLLRAAARAFRLGDSLSLPAEAYARSLDVARAAPTRANIRHLRQLRSWHDFAQAQPVLPGRRVTAPAGRRRALYVLWRCLPYDQNGYVLRSHYLLRGLLGTGEDVIAVSRLGYPWDAEKRMPAGAMLETEDGVPYLHLGGAEANRLTMTLHAYIAECADRIAMAALSAGADLIHAASNWMVGLPALMAARMTGLPFCYEMRGLWEVTRASYTPGYEASEHFALFRDMESFVAARADLLFTITRGVRSEMARRGVDISAARIAPNGCDTSRFVPAPRNAALAATVGIAPGEVVLGYIGTFAQYEGLPDLCRAAAELHRRGIAFRLLIVGDGPARAEMEALLRDLDHGGRIILLDRVPFDAVPDYYSLVDIAVFPRIPTAITELVSPLKPFEAMAMAKPVIGSDVEAIAEIVRHGETGWLFRKGSLDSLVETLQAALASPEAVRRAGEAARRFVQRHHEWHVIAGHVAEGWRDLRAARGG
ncbi:glycosyltransferase family 4 protein [Falsiroseomonas sp. CW058]|uniref:glycosyltransferase family 4 protein n=1 Tax=Falsiroseomonas sp. CW058 TaxID=3388664 RepID=UPI003D31F4AC